MFGKQVTLTQASRHLHWACNCSFRWWRTGSWNNDGRRVCYAGDVTFTLYKVKKYIQRRTGRHKCSSQLISGIHTRSLVLTRKRHLKLIVRIPEYLPTDRGWYRRTSAILAYGRRIDTGKIGGVGIFSSVVPNLTDIYVSLSKEFLHQNHWRECKFRLGITIHLW